MTHWVTVVLLAMNVLAINVLIVCLASAGRFVGVAIAIVANTMFGRLDCCRRLLEGVFDGRWPPLGERTVCGMIGALASRISAGLWDSVVLLSLPLFVAAATVGVFERHPEVWAVAVWPVGVLLSIPVAQDRHEEWSHLANQVWRWLFCSVCPLLFVVCLLFPTVVPDLYAEFWRCW